ncbi:hypothetical protein ACFSJY_16120 [Thalassotalea euphylliae]|uniref:hypothetical protein n=1 Tax=Thalassotalea euphylliae TaxID=1655234 RepID=UPI0036322854
MCRNANSLQRQGGSILVLALFILVVMFLLGAALARLLSSGAEATAYEVLGTRAFQAANSGAQLKLLDVFPLDTATPQNCSAGDATTPTDSATNNYSFVNVDGLNNCSATVSCNMQEVDGVYYYQLTSTGQCVIDSAEGVTTSRTIELEARSL